MGAQLFDPTILLAMGLNPKTGLPAKIGGNPANLKEDIKRVLRIMDEQDAVNRIKWNKFPGRLTSQEIERLVYYKGQLCFFYLKDLEQYFLMPYALNGSIDFYGRFNYVHPVPFGGGVDEKTNKLQSEYLANIKLKVIYCKDDIVEGEDVSGYCILLHDYTKQVSQTIIPRQVINDPILDAMAECIPYMRTSMINSTGVKGVRAADADQCDAIREAGKSIVKCALTGEQYAPIVGSMEFQELSDGPTAKASEYFMAMQSLDNFRLQTYGLDNKGLFEKQAHTTNAENSLNSSSSSQKMQDCIEIRKNFCDLANAIWGLDISVEENKTNEVAISDQLLYNKGGDNYDSQDTTI